MSEKHERFGLTLVEVMVALGLCAVVFAAAYPLLISSTRKLSQARDHYAATTICLARVEQARDIPYDQLPTALGFDNLVRVNDQGTPDPAGRFRRTTVVQVNVPEAGVTTVIVTTDILSRRTGAFTNEKETMSYMFTTYLKPVG